MRWASFSAEAWISARPSSTRFLKSPGIEAGAAEAGWFRAANHSNDNDNNKMTMREMDDQAPGWAAENQTPNFKPKQEQAQHTLDQGDLGLELLDEALGFVGPLLESRQVLDRAGHDKG